MEIIHTMIRVTDLEESIDFYSELLGMHEIRRKDFPNNDFTLVFMGYGDGGPEVELTDNWGDEEPYDLGDGWGHIALEVEDIEQTVQDAKDYGAEVSLEPMSMEGSGTILAFIKDPDGYPIELIQEGTLSKL